VTAEDKVKELAMTESGRADGEEPTVTLGRIDNPSPVKVGMLIFLLSEAAFFGTLIMTYAFFLRQTTQGEPNPSQVFRLPMVLGASVCLFSSSATIHAAERSLCRNSQQAFLGWWGLTIMLGVLFLIGTMLEWNELIAKWGLTISRNLFGSTYFTLVGFHALHVTVGVIVMSIVFGLAWRWEVAQRNQTGVEVVSWYWHFVDGVWAVVFTLVYVVGRG
jgi:cytochrome c oxidase subunit 3/cytochrome o ubiquinol oxidase subunit 3